MTEPADDEEIEVFQLLLPQSVTVVGQLAAAIDRAAEDMGYEALLRVREDKERRPVIVLRKARYRT